jgi:hypothetical protein
MKTRWKLHLPGVGTSDCPGAGSRPSEGDVGNFLGISGGAAAGGAAGAALGDRASRLPSGVQPPEREV